MGTCAVVSFRLGLSDGVSIVASAWSRVLVELGWTVTTVAGEGPVDRILPGLAIDAAAAGNAERVAADLDRALADADLVLVENLLSIPLNLPASRALARVLAGRPALLHHHDPPWQRARFAHVTELPPDDPAWAHVTINRMTEREFAARAIEATTIYNGFDPEPPPGDRDGTRARLGIDDDRLLAAHPVRAIARKNIPAAIALAERLDATYWIPNPAEEDYHAEFERVLAAARCPVLRHPVDETGLTMSDLYAACDLVLFPSTWEGFGNPPIEAAIHRRPAVVGHYPVAEELREIGFRWFDPDRPDTIAEAMNAGPSQDGAAGMAELLDHNQRLAAAHLSVERMSREIDKLLTARGWTP